MIVLKKAFKRYPKGVEALKDVELNFPEKGLVIIQGKSGCGKSTLLNVIGGLDVLTSGYLFYGGKLIFRKNIEEYRRKNVSFIFQDMQLFEEMTVSENVALASEITGKKADSERVAEILKSVGMEDCAERYPNELSGGQMQRVAIARGLMKEGATILADEPTGNLDSENAENIFSLLKEIAKERLVVAVTHDREFAEIYADYRVYMKDGRVVENGLAEVKAKKKSEEPTTFQKERRFLPLKTSAKLARWSLKSKVGKQIFIMVALVIMLSIFGFGYSFTKLSEYSLNASISKDRPNPTMMVDNENSFLKRNSSLLRTTLSTIQAAELEQEFGMKIAPVYELGFEVIQNYAAKWIDGAQTGSFMSLYEQGLYQELEYFIFTDNMAEYEMEIVEGDAPKTDMEICIPKIMADYIVHNGYFQASITGVFKQPEDILSTVYYIDGKKSNDIRTVNSYKDIMGLPIYHGSLRFNICGIFDDRDMIKPEYRYLDKEVALKKASENGGEKEFGYLSDLYEAYTSRSAVLSESALMRLNGKGELREQTGRSNFTVESPEFDNVDYGGVGKIDKNDIALPSEFRNKNLNKDEILINKALAEKLNKGVGDTLELSISWGSRSLDMRTYTIAGLLTNSTFYNRDYFGNDLNTKSISLYSYYLSDETYDTLFSRDNIPVGKFIFNARKQKNLADMLERLENSYTEKVDDGTYNEGLIIYSDSAKSSVYGLDTLFEVKYFVSIPVMAISAIISILLLASFTSINIDAKFRQVGILKAMGARKRDVNSIFAVQSAIIVSILFAAGVLTGVGLLAILNAVVMFFYPAGAKNTFLYSADNFFVVMALTGMVTAIALWLKLHFLNKRTAVEVIRNTDTRSSKRSARKTADE